MNTPRDKLDALLALLNSAAKAAIAEYERTGDVPSTESAHQLDAQPATLALKTALRILEGACDQLCATLAPPAQTLLTRANLIYEPIFMRFAIEAKLADVLVGEPEGLPVADIAKQTGIEQGKLARILRFLATRHCFREVRHNIFANSRLSLLLVSSTPLPNIFLLGTSLACVSMDKLYACLKDPEYGPSMEVGKSPFMYGIKDEGLNDFFDYLKHHPDTEQLFASAMVALSQITGNGISLVKDLPWKNMAPGSTICDIGSGIGAVSLELAAAHLHLKLTLQDQAHILEQARHLWSNAYPKVQYVDFVPLDFFKEGPVRDQDIYYMRHVIHDWPDDLATAILKNIKHSMKPESRLLIHEHILHGLHRHDFSNSTDVMIAPEPLLANFGVGNIRPYFQDVNMMVLFNAKERSLDEFKALGVQAGLKFVRVWDIGDSGIVEFKVPM